MNVCIVNGFFPPYTSGSARLAYLLADQFSKRSHHVIVITSRVGGTPAFEERGGMVIYRLRSLKYPKTDLFHNSDLYWNLLPQNLGKIVRILKQHRIEVVQAFGQYQDLTLMSALACKVLRIPMVLSITVRMEHPKPFLSGLLVSGDKVLVKNLVARKASTVVALDRQMGDYIADRYRVDGASIPFIPLAVDIGRFEHCDGRLVRKMYHLDKKQPIILSLGTISNYRNPKSLIRAMPEVLKESPNAKLLLVGAVYNADPIHLVRELGLEKSVIFTGRVDYEMIPSYLGACEVEGHDLESGLGVGLASLEAMAAGKVVLSSARANNFPTLELESWKNIVLVRPGNVKNISDALRRLLSDEKMREKIGKNAREFVTDYFTLERICASYESLYQEIVHNSLTGHQRPLDSAPTKMSGSLITWMNQR